MVWVLSVLLVLAVSVIAWLARELVRFGGKLAPITVEDDDSGDDPVRADIRAFTIKMAFHGYVTECDFRGNMFAVFGKSSATAPGKEP